MRHLQSQQPANGGQHIRYREKRECNALNLLERVQRRMLGELLITLRRTIDCAMKNIQWLRRLEADTRLYNAATIYTWLVGMPNHMLEGDLFRAISGSARLIYA
jgi:hypothetical protein